MAQSESVRVKERERVREARMGGMEEAGVTEPLLGFNGNSRNGGHSREAFFTGKEGDRESIRGVKDFFREFATESKVLWFLAGPAMFTAICQYSLGAVTQIVAGQLGTIELAAVSVENSVIAGLSFGLMVLTYSLRFRTAF